MGEGLLDAAPAALRKSMSKRRTFDNVVVQSLDVAFAKTNDALRSEQQQTQQTLNDRNHTLKQAQEALAIAKERRRLALQQIEEAAEVEHSGKKSGIAAKPKMRIMPKIFKQTLRTLQQAQANNRKFRKGPLEEYMQHGGAEIIDDHEFTEVDE